VAGGVDDLGQGGFSNCVGWEDGSRVTESGRVGCGVSEGSWVSSRVSKSSWVSGRVAESSAVGDGVSSGVSKSWVGSVIGNGVSSSVGDGSNGSTLLSQGSELNFFMGSEVSSTGFDDFGGVKDGGGSSDSSGNNVDWSLGKSIALGTEATSISDVVDTD
jgi:hypothetical protein